MESNNSQQILFNHIKGLIPQNLVLVDVIAEVLNISNDSAYRRIRGVKPISLDEAKTLASHFKISVDQILNLESDVYIFSGKFTNSTDFKYYDWLESVAGYLQYFLSFQPNHWFYFAKEVPFFYYYLIPEIAAFKSFFFMKSILSYEDWKAAKFSVTDDYSQYHDITQKCSKLFAALPSTEIWNIENITSTLHQIEFYRVTGALKSNEDALILFDKLSVMVDHLEIQAEHGVKLLYGQDPSTGRAPFKLFVNELLLGDNMQIIQYGNKQATAVNHSVMNYLLTSDESFNTHSKKTFDNIIQKSTLISEVNEKERLLFFNKLRAKVQHAKQQVV